MPESDRERWDQRYAAGKGPAHFDPQALLVEHEHLLKGGVALDAACGFGGSSLYLAARGYAVHALDVSGVALAKAQAEARRRALEISFVQADIGRWRVPPSQYDLAIVAFFLERALTPALASGLRPGGLLFQINRNRHYLSARPCFHRSYLVEPDELRQTAQQLGLEVILFTETHLEPFTSQLIARRPVAG